ncbi:MAG: MFS transporter [Oscillospiraceae bacterium]|nr:MFS transporter [Oscillospiraceae bacterium]MCL2279166.1 MFS transporter [Oscillospiraceae bacterium]
MVEAENQVSARERNIVTASALSSIFIFSFIIALPGVLINEVVDTFSLGGFSEGLMGTFTNIGFMVSMFFVVLVQGRVKKTKLFIFALCLQAVALFVTGFSPTFFIFLLGSLILGFSNGFIDSCSNSAIVDVQGEGCSKYLGYLHGLFGVGALLAPLVFMVALRFIDWRGIHFALTGFSVLVMVFIFSLTRGLGAEKKQETKVREHLFTASDLRAYLRVRRNVALSLAGMFGMFALFAVLIWIVRYMTLRFDAEDIGLLSVTIYWICATANRLLFARFVKNASMLFVAIGALLSGAAVFIGVASGNPIVLCVMMGVFGFCSGHFVQVLVAECAAGYKGRTSFTTSFLMFVMCIARIGAPVIMAFVGTQVSLFGGMMIPVVACLLTAVFSWYAMKSQQPQTAV